MVTCILRKGLLLVFLLCFGLVRGMAQTDSAALVDTLVQRLNDTVAQPDSGAILAAQVTRYRMQLDSIWKQRQHDSLRKQQL